MAGKKTRTGLRDLMFDAIDQMKEGKMAPAAVKALVGVANSVWAGERNALALYKARGEKPEATEFIDLPAQH